MLASEGPHRDARGRFRNPWPDAQPRGFGDFLRWMVLERWRTPRAPNPPRGSVARAAPSFASPRAGPDELTVTWVGHSTFLVQVGGLNVLTDPMWGERASPLPFAGPRRWAAPGVDLDALPPIDVVLQSHDHYDHLHAGTVGRLVRAHPAAQWFAPLGVGAWLRRRGVKRVRELDWWGEATVENGRELVGRTAGAHAAWGGPPTGNLPPNDGSAGPSPRRPERGNAAAGGAEGGAAAAAEDGAARVTCLPAQHFAGRGLRDRNATLWCGFALRVGGRSVYFAGDTALHPEFEAIARRAGPFDLALLPIGAYAPRWFMRVVHADPDDAVAVYGALVRGNGGRRLVCGGMHWGTFRLTDEPMDEPPRLMAERWVAAGLTPADLWVPAVGETRRV